MLKKTSLDKAKIKILLLEGIHRTAVEAFRRDGYTRIEHHPKALPEADLLAAARDAYFIGIRSGTELTARFFEQSKRVAGVGCFCIGTNQVDLEAAQARGVPVFNAPFSNTRSVAELVLAEAILLLRGIPFRSGRRSPGRLGQDRRRIARSPRALPGHRRIRAYRLADQRACRSPSA